MHIQGAIGPNHKVGPGDFLFHGPLCSQTLFNLMRCPAACLQSFALRGGGTGGTNNFVKGCFGLGFEKQWNHHNGQGSIFPAPVFDLGEPPFANARVKDGFELFAGRGIGKDYTRKLIPAETPVRIDDLAAKFSPNFCQGSLAGFGKLSCEFVGIHHRDAPGLQVLGRSGFAHAHATRQTAYFHRLAVVVLYQCPGTER